MTSETNRVQNFIDVHKNLVLRDALRDLESCEAERIPNLLHRLKGTLGTFQFSTLSLNLRELSDASKGENHPKTLLEKRDEAIKLIKQELEIEVKE